jgi:cytochrome c oxidase assembly protein Cox11
LSLFGIANPPQISPPKVAPYFAKIECFCFEEQKLLAGEEVDLPLFFFIDKDFMDDPLMNDIDDIVLSYTFFKFVPSILSVVQEVSDHVLVSQSKTK